MEQLNKFYMVILGNNRESDLLNYLEKSEKEVRVYSSLEDALKQEYIMHTFNYNAVLFAREYLKGNVITAKDLMNGIENVDGIIKSNNKLYVYEITLKEDILLLGSVDESLLALPIYNQDFGIKYTIKDKSIIEKLDKDYFNASLIDTMNNLDNSKYALVNYENILNYKLVAESDKELKTAQSDDYMYIYNEALSQEMRFLLDDVKVI